MKNPNKNRQNYKKTKVGWIPDDWECLHLRDVFVKRDERGREGMPVLSVTKDRGMIPRNELDRKMAPSLSPTQSLLVEPDDIVYNMMRMWQGAVGVASTKGVVSPAYVVCRPQKARADSHFMYHLFKSHRGLHRLMSYSYGITGDRLRLYFPDFGLVPAPLPPLSEQKKIVKILSTWNEAIVRLRKLIDLKKRRKKALMQQLLTGKKRLHEFEAPWRHWRLGDLFAERIETARTDLPLLAITRSRGILPSKELDRKDSSSANKARYKRIVPGDIGYNTMRMWQGVSALSSLEGIVSPAYTICVPKESVHGSFMAHFFKFPPIVHLFWRYSQGLVSDTWNLKFHNFAQITVEVPGKPEQKAIAMVLQSADQETSNLEDILQEQERQKRGLMQKLLTGSIRVGVDRERSA